MDAQSTKVPQVPAQQRPLVIKGISIVDVRAFH
jgi:hypothetical protein